MGPEKKIQTAVIEYLKRQLVEHPDVKCVYRKVQGGRYGTNGWPDYEIFAQRWGATSVLMLEFKAPGKPLTALQANRFVQLQSAGVTCEVCDNIEVGKRLVDAALGFYL
jgi:hypothetical protein